MRSLLTAGLVCGTALGGALMPACGKAPGEPPAPMTSAVPYAVAPAESASAFASASASASAFPSASASVSASASGPLISTGRFLAWVYEKPRLDAPKAGWIRAGTRVVRSAEPLAGAGCKGKWWAVEPAGFVCEGQDGVTTDLEDKAVVAAAARPPDVTSPFPYGYATSNGAPLYVRIPTKEQQQKLEGDVEAHLANVAKLRAKTPPDKLPPESALPVGPIPSFLENHAQVPNILPWNVPSGAVRVGEAWRTMRLSLLSAFESEGRTFYLTTEHYIVPADRMRAARLADFQGVHLAGPDEQGEHLPMVWVRWKPARLHLLENGKAVAKDHLMPFQAHAGIAKKERVIDGTKYFELLAPPAGVPEGTWLVRAEGTTKVDAATELPYDVGPDERWIEVSIQRQSLVLYQGLRPLFVTLVSTGVDVNGDPETSRATPRGHYRIGNKHLSWRMAGDEKPPAKEGEQPDPRYRIDDVPYVQYFHGGYALHAAFWHDSFGNPKSHGCINLSPRDALWMFGQTEPKVPVGWHGVYSGRAGAAKGTTLIVHM
ncbi:MAG: L,D-transpeptidase [Deltaproteobacteria bacterium]|nr:L,D-transpeptidase [Deltaproteobacteria bacterium]